MKYSKIVPILLTSLFLSKTRAQMAAVAAPTANVNDYKAYLTKTGFPPVSDVFLEQSRLQYEEKSLNECLETYWLPHPDWKICWQAVLDLSAAPYSEERKDLVTSLLKKLSPLKGPYGKKMQGLQMNLGRSISGLKRMSKISNLEKKAWQRGLEKAQIKNYRIFLNGEPFSPTKSSARPDGIFQWSLISDSHEPLTVIGSWQEFAAESVQNIKPWISNDCHTQELSEKLKKLNVGLALFQSEKCLSIFAKDLAATKKHESALQNAISIKDIDTQPKSSWTESKWILPVATIVGVGLAASLKNKRVTVHW